MRTWARAQVAPDDLGAGGATGRVRGAPKWLGRAGGRGAWAAGGGRRAALGGGGGGARARLASGRRQRIRSLMSHSNWARAPGGRLELAAGA